MGGMAAQIPDRRNPAVNEAAFAKVRADKEREAKAGHDGTWVAHPDLVPVADGDLRPAHAASRTSSTRLREDVAVGQKDLLEVHEGTRTEAGLRENIRVGVQYIEAWLRGRGAVPLYNLMEDAATAEISRSQIWQQLHFGASARRRPEGHARTVRASCLSEEMERVRGEIGEKAHDDGRFPEAIDLFRNLSTAPTPFAVPDPAGLPPHRLTSRENRGWTATSSLSAPVLQRHRCIPAAGARPFRPHGRSQTVARSKALRRRSDHQDPRLDALVGGAGHRTRHPRRHHRHQEADGPRSQHFGHVDPSAPSPYAVPSIASISTRRLPPARNSKRPAAVDAIEAAFRWLSSPSSTAVAISSRYLVGADGANSIVRRFAAARWRLPPRLRPRGHRAPCRACPANRPWSCSSMSSSAAMAGSFRRATTSMSASTPPTAR